MQCRKKRLKASKLSPDRHSQAVKSVFTFPPCSVQSKAEFWMSFTSIWLVDRHVAVGHTLVHYEGPTIMIILTRFKACLHRKWWVWRSLQNMTVMCRLIIFWITASVASFAPSTQLAYISSFRWGETSNFLSLIAADLTIFAALSSGGPRQAGKLNNKVSVFIKSCGGLQSCAAQLCASRHAATAGTLALAISVTIPWCMKSCCTAPCYANTVLVVLTATSVRTSGCLCHKNVGLSVNECQCWLAVATQHHMNSPEKFHILNWRDEAMDAMDAESRDSYRTMCLIVSLHWLCTYSCGVHRVHHFLCKQALRIRLRIIMIKHLIVDNN